MFLRGLYVANHDELKAKVEKLKQKLPTKPTRSTNQVYGATVVKSLQTGTPSNPATNVPGAVMGSLRDNGYSFMKASAYATGMIDKDGCREEHEIGLKLKSIFGQSYNFGFNPKSMLVVGSTRFLPTCGVNGEEIPGAELVIKELNQRLGEVNKMVDSEKVVGRYKALNTQLEVQGGAMVPFPELGEVIGLQVNQEVFSAAGARNETLPPGGRKFYPKVTNASTAYWVGETGSITNSQPTTGGLSLEAKKLANRIPVTNELLRFSDPNAEAWLRMDMATQMALAMDKACLDGTGGTQIKGLITYETATSWSQGVNKLLAYTSTGSPADANSGYPFQPQDVYNIDGLLPDGVSATAWVARRNWVPYVLNRRADAVSGGDGKGMFMFDAFRQAAMGPSPTLAGTPIVRSSQISNTRTRGTGTTSNTYLLYGNFQSWTIARSGIMELMVDPYTSMQNYITNLQCVQLVDAGALHPEHFVFCDNLLFG